MKRKILAIGMIDSVHFARWLAAISEIDAEVTIFPSGPNRATSPRIMELVHSRRDNFKLSEFMRRFSLTIWIADRLFGDFLRSRILRNILAKHFDVVHYHEMQSGGYPLRLVPAKLLANSRVVYTPYGSDLYWFENRPGHLEKIRKTLAITDAMFPECQRDAQIATRLGFKGQILNSLPASGWREVVINSPKEFAERRKITIKSYGGRWGEIEKIIAGLEQIQHILRNFELHFISVSGNVNKHVRKFSKGVGADVWVHKKFTLSEDEVRKLLSESKYYISISKSDGFPSTLFEAVSQGAIPIQSDTACIPDSLASISPKSFIKPDQFASIAEQIALLEKEPNNAEQLSKDLEHWAIEHQEFRDELLPVLLFFYGFSEGNREI